VDVYIHSPIRFRGVVLNYLSTGTTLPYLSRKSAQTVSLLSHDLEVPGSNLDRVMIVDVRLTRKTVSSVPSPYSHAIKSEVISERGSS
jgi:hypothetical protein